MKESRIEARLEKGNLGKSKNLRRKKTGKKSRIKEKAEKAEK